MQPTKPKSALQIAWTDKLDVFQQHGRQRALRKNHVKAIAASMAAHGFLSSKPIQCFRDGKFLRVIDGHNRLAAAQHLKIGVYYVIVDASESSLIGEINSTVSRWNLEAFINYHILGGNKHYAKIHEYVEKGLPLGIAVASLSGYSTTGGRACEQIASGTWKVKTTEQADTLLSITKCLDGIAVAKSTAFLSALSVLLQLPQFDPSILVQRLTVNPSLLERRSNRDQMLDQLEEIYNFRTRDKINLAFLAKEHLRAKKEKCLDRSKTKS